jgi:hypothetical protein
MHGMNTYVERRGRLSVRMLQLDYRWADFMKYDT